MAHIHVDQSPVVTGYNMRSRVKTRQSVPTAQAPSIFTIKPMESCFHKMDHRFIGSFLPRAIYFIPRFLLLTAPQIDEDHQHARFKNLGINFERFMKGNFSLFVIFRAAEAFEDAVDMASTQTVVG